MCGGEVREGREGGGVRRGEGEEVMSSSPTTTRGIRL